MGVGRPRRDDDRWADHDDGIEEALGGTIEDGAGLSMADPTGGPTSTAGSDALLVQAAIRGDADAMRRVWESNARWVAAIILAHKPTRTDLEDLLQDVALAFVKRIGEVRDPAAVRPWLRTIAINAARAAGRGVTVERKHRTGIRLVREQTDANRAEIDAGEAIESRSDQSVLLKMALDLPEAYREPLLLRAARGMSYRQIAQVTGLPETTIETRIARGRRMLREMAKGGTAGKSTARRGAVEGKTGGEA